MYTENPSEHIEKFNDLAEKLSKIKRVFSYDFEKNYIENDVENLNLEISKIYKNFSETEKRHNYSKYLNARIYCLIYHISKYLLFHTEKCDRFRILRCKIFESSEIFNEITNIYNFFIKTLNFWKEFIILDYFDENDTNINNLKFAIIVRDKIIDYEKDLSEFINGFEYFVAKKMFVNGMTKESAEKLYNKIHNIIPGYEVLKKLGSGVFGTVYKCLKKDTLEICAIKKQLKNEDNFEAKFLKTIKDHCQKYFLCYIDDFEIFDDYYIVFEYLENYQTIYDSVFVLHDRIHGLKNPVKSSVLKGFGLFITIFKNLLDGLKILHDQKIIHHDIHTSNIMVNIKNGDIKYIDFGLSCYYDKCSKYKYSKNTGKEILNIGDFKSLSLSKMNDDKHKTFEELKKDDLVSVGNVMIKILTNYNKIADKKVNEFLKKNKCNFNIKNLNNWDKYEIS